MAYIARTDGSREEIDAQDVKLKRAQEIVGGYVERVCPRAEPSVIFLCDGEGLLKGKPINAHGCALYGTLEHGHPIVGDIIVLTRKEGRSWL